MPEHIDPFGIDTPAPEPEATPVDREQALADLEAPPADTSPPAAGGRTDEDRRLEGLTVELPSGGKMVLFSSEEVALWKDGADRYVRGHQISEYNDMLQVTAALQASLTMYRANQLLGGMTPKMDPNTHRPTGRYEPGRLPTDAATDAAHGRIAKAISQIQGVDKALGIDRKTRDGGNKQSVANFIEQAKGAADQFGLHIAERTLAYEEFVMGLRWRHRVLTSHDEEDRKEHNLTEATLIQWIGDELAKLEQVDVDFATQKGKLVVGMFR